MSKSRLQPRPLFHYVLGCLGVALLVLLVVRAGPAALLENVKLVGWGLVLIIALGGLSHLIKAWAWRLALPRDVHYSLLRMFGLRLVSEAIGQLGFAGVVAGEATKVALLGPEVPLASRILSVTLDRGLFIACGATVTVSGIVASLLLLPLSHTLRIYAVLFAIGFFGILLTAAFAVRNRWPLLQAPARAFGRVPWIGRWVQSKESLIASVEEKLLEFHRERPSAFWGAVALNFLCHGLAITEVFLILLFLGKDITWMQALIFESLTKLINVAGALTPGNVGIYEGGTMLIGRLFGLSGAVGLTLGLCRRMRALFWTLVGVLSFFVVSKSTNSLQANGRSDSAQSEKPVPLNDFQSEVRCESSPQSITAIVLEDCQDAQGIMPELAHVGALPVILRAILQARAIGANRIIVAASGTSGNRIRRELLHTGRLPQTVEWFELDSEPRPLAQLFSKVAAHSDRIVLVSGANVYHPCLFERIRECTGSGEAVALTTGGQFAGIATISSQGALDIARDCPRDVRTPLELYAWLKRRHSFAFQEVDGQLWQAVIAPGDRLLAERKLDRWLVKPTDGLFAQMNRRISIPISRQLIKFPITPNMVTLFTLGVSFLAGVFFMIGGYWNNVAGALLSLCASILDGCDGEVARLKLQASNFGCWLETVCDYLYYLFIFAGMSVGLSKSRGSKDYLVWGGVLLFGAVASFLVVGAARQRFAALQPEKFLHWWHGKADKQKTNPLVYLARNTEFLIRRCCLPYILLAFAVVNLTRFFFIGSAVGANVVWIVALYSNWVISRPASPPTLSAAPKKNRAPWTNRTVPTPE